MNKRKRTEEILEAFTRVPSDRLCLILIGSLDEDVRANVETLVACDDRIGLLSWRSGDDLLDYLCASDLYMQPRSQSATMQNAICCGNAVAVYPYTSHKVILEDRAFYVESREDIEHLLIHLECNPDALKEKHEALHKLALEALDYRVLAARLYR